MVTLRQTYDICKKGYRYDIEHDRFISDKEDVREWAKEYGPIEYKCILAAKKWMKRTIDLLKERKDEVKKEWPV